MQCVWQWGDAACVVHTHMFLFVSWFNQMNPWWCLVLDVQKYRNIPHILDVFFRLQFKSSIVCVCILHRSYKQYILYMDFSWISYSNVHRFLSELLLWLNDNFSMVCPSCGIFHWLTLWVSHGFRLYKVAVLWTGQRNQIYSH